MRLTAAIAAFGLVAIPAAVTLAGDPKPGAGRYELQPNEAGFVRLDTVTGAISHCLPNDGAWTCTRLDAPGDDGTLALFRDDIRRLDTAVADLKARLDALTPPEPVAEPEAPPAVAGFVAQVMDRFLTMVRLLKHGDAEV